MDLEKLDKAYDDKLTVFMSTITSDYESKIANTKAVVTKDMQQMESKLRNSILVEKEKEKKSNTGPALTDLEIIKNNFNETHEKILNDIEKLQTQMVLADTRIKSLSILISTNYDMSVINSRTDSMETKIDSLLNNSHTLPKNSADNILNEIKIIQHNLTKMINERSGFMQSTQNCLNHMNITQPPPPPPAPPPNPQPPPSKPSGATKNINNATT